MYSAGEDRTPIRLISHHNDIPTVVSDFLIPSSQRKRKADTIPTTHTPHPFKSSRFITAGVAALLMMSLTFGSVTLWATEGVDTMAAPIVVITSDYSESSTPLSYGAQPLLSQPNFFAETHESFIAEKFSFIEADLTRMHIRYFEAGEEVFSAPILSKGKESSWWETPAGLYQVEVKKEEHFSSFGNVTQPWNLVFQGNFFIHGWPKYPDGTPVPEGYSGGCIRLSDEDAQKLYELVSVETPVLVHEADFESDDFVYEPKVPDITAPHYLVADIKSNTVLASSDLDAQAPIASVTKLMTALVAAEYINLDSTVRVSQEQYVTTLIPRLEGRTRVSMYSLLQLLLVESSNEAAEVIATQLGRDEFIKLMNEKALSLGLTGTTFTDASGLDDGNVSTVGDLLRLVQYIHFNRSFILELTLNQDLPTAYVSGEFGELENFNLFKDIDNLLGGKVGETLAAGQTSVTLHKVNVSGVDRTLAVIVLGSLEREADVKKLLEYTEARFTQ